MSWVADMVQAGRQLVRDVTQLPVLQRWYRMRRLLAECDPLVPNAEWRVSKLPFPLLDPRDTAVLWSEDGSNDLRLRWALRTGDAKEAPTGLPGSADVQGQLSRPVRGCWFRVAVTVSTWYAAQGRLLDWEIVCDVVLDRATPEMRQARGWAHNELAAINRPRGPPAGGPGGDRQGGVRSPGPRPGTEPPQPGPDRAGRR